MRLYSGVNIPAILNNSPFFLLLHFLLLTRWRWWEASPPFATTFIIIFLRKFFRIRNIKINLGPKRYSHLKIIIIFILRDILVAILGNILLEITLLNLFIEKIKALHSIEYLVGASLEQLGSSNAEWKQNLD